MPFSGVQLATQRRSVPDEREITALLHQWRNGSSEAENELFTLVLPDLRRIAHRLMNRERAGHTLQASELVDQIYMRLAGAKDLDWENRTHFFAVAGRAMRRYLIDHARGRPNAEFVLLDDLQHVLASPDNSLGLALSIDVLLDKLAATRPEWCTLVELKFFMGFTDEEAADALGMKVRTMQRMWLEARRWLFEQVEARRASTSAG
jgi:RNA polymerase sigma-70 factor, ECF subfamily